MIKYLKYIRTYSDKVKKHMLNDLDVQHGLIVAKQIRGYDIVVGYRDDVARERKNYKLLDSEVIMDSKDVCAIVDFSLANCSVCEYIGKEAMDCNIRKIYIKYDVDVVNNECDTLCSNGCPYRVQSKK